MQSNNTLNTNVSERDDNHHEDKDQTKHWSKNIQNNYTHPHTKLCKYRLILTEITLFGSSKIL